MSVPKAIACLLLAMIPFLGRADQAVWIFEISYISGRTVQHGYVQFDYWVGNEDWKNDQRAFQKLWSQFTRNRESLVVYREMHDQSDLVEKVPFPMQPYQLDGSTAAQVDPKKISNPKLLNSYIISAYYIDLITPIEAADTLWIHDNFKVYHPIGEDVGCRLEVYDFGDNDLDLDLLAQYFSREQPVGEGAPQQLEALVAALKKKKVVLVELCGC